MREKLGLPAETASLSRRAPQLPRPVDSAIIGCTSFAVVWNRTYCEHVVARGYPAELEDTGWHPLDDYIEEEERRRRIDLTTPAEGGGFTLRVVFGAGLSFRELLGPDGRPSPASEWLTWAREETGAGSRYRIDYGRPGEALVHVSVPIPQHPGLPGRRTVAAARAYAALAHRWDAPASADSIPEAASRK